MRLLLGTTLLITVATAPASAQQAKPAGLKAGGASRAKVDSATPTTPVPPKIEMPAPAVMIPKPPTAPTARDRAGLAKATRAIQTAPRGTPATPGRRTPPE